MLDAKKQKGDVVLKFGGGLNSQKIPRDIHERECQAGVNFDLPTDNAYLKPRKGIYKACIAPNGAPIRGFAQLVKADGTRSVLIQAGGTVYVWDGTSGTGGMTAVGTTQSGALLRGQIEANSPKDGLVLITDLNQLEVVLTWDGTTLQPLSTNLSSNFYAKYACIANERAIFANVKAATTLPHVICASKVSGSANNLGNLSTSNTPSSSLSASDPFFLSTGNLAAISGIIPAFGRVAFPTKSTNWYELTGLDATDHALSILYASASGKGAEEVVFAGNDVVFGKQGGIDTLSATQRFGNVQSDDLTRWIADDVRGVLSWTLVYCERLDRVYCVPLNGGKVYVLHKAFLDQRIRAALFGSDPGDISPWSVWTTSNTFNYEPTAAMRLFRPSDGLEFVYMGDRAGNVWQLDADTGSDGGTAFTMSRTSAPIAVEPSRMYRINGWVKSRKEFAGNLMITALWGGRETFDSTTTTISLAAATNAPVWGGGSYWGGGAYWNVSFNARIQRTDFTLDGGGDEVAFQVSAASSSLADYAIEEVGIQIAPEASPEP